MDSFYIWHKWSLSLEGGVAYYVFFRIWKFKFLANFLNLSALTLKKKLQFSMDSLHIWYKWSLVWEGMLHIMTFDLDLYLQGHSTLNFENSVRSVASTVLDGFFPYLLQMITSMRRCVACDALWPWPISSRSFDLDFENRVRSVKFSVLHRLFPYVPQIIITIRGCVAC